MNTGFLRLAKNDQGLVDDMKKAIVSLWTDARRREVLYVAIEHNIKYITNMCQTSDRERDESRAENRQLIKTAADKAKEFEKINKRFKALEKESEMLQEERKLTGKLKLEVQQKDDKIANVDTALKEMKRNLKKTEGSAEEIKAERDDLKKKSVFQKENLDALEKLKRELEMKFAQATDDIAGLNGVNQKYRDTVVQNEELLSK